MGARPVNLPLFNSGSTYTVASVPRNFKKKAGADLEGLAKLSQVIEHPSQFWIGTALKKGMRRKTGTGLCRYSEHPQHLAGPP